MKQTYEEIKQDSKGMKKGTIASRIDKAVPGFLHSYKYSTTMKTLLLKCIELNLKLK